MLSILFETSGTGQICLTFLSKIVEKINAIKKTKIDNKVRQI